MKQYKVYVMLQEYKSTFSRICSLIKNSNYNHASIGISDSMDEFYSFRAKWGLCIEHPFVFNKEHKKQVRCTIYEIEVSEDQYNDVKNKIQAFVDNRDHYHFSYFSVILAFMKIQHTFKKGYYCSRFVAEVLKETNVVNIRKHPSLYLPSDLTDEIYNIHYQGLAVDYSLTSI